MLPVFLFQLSIFKLKNKFKLTHILFQLSVHFTVGLCDLHQNNALEEKKSRFYFSDHSNTSNNLKKKKTHRRSVCTCQSMK